MLCSSEEHQEVLYAEGQGALYVEEVGSFVRRGATVDWPTEARHTPLLLPVFTP